MGIRQLPWWVKFMLVAVAWLGLSPVLFRIGAAAWAVADLAGVLVWMGGLVWASSWFVFTSGRKPHLTSLDFPSQQFRDEPWTASIGATADSRPPPAARGAATVLERDLRRYCEACGWAYDTLGPRQCPACGAAWNAAAPERIDAVAHALNLWTEEHRQGRIDGASFTRVRERFEARLVELRRASPLAHEAPPPASAYAAYGASTPVRFTPPEVTAETSVSAASLAAPVEEATSPAVDVEVAPLTVANVPFALPEPPPGPAVPEPANEAAERIAAADVLARARSGLTVGASAPTEASALASPPPAPATPEPAEPGLTVGEIGRAAIGWAAERQADILLYVGAFLLSIAAVIFVAYQGDTVSGVLRFAILSAYAAGFLGLGLSLHRWERVKEAGPVFLALGAILVPIDFIALRTQVLGQDQLPPDVLWLIASAATAGLWATLAARGHGKLYAVPCVPALLIAWASLGSVINLPEEWFGPWFAALFGGSYSGASRLIGHKPQAKWAAAGAAAGAFLALAWTHAAVAWTADHRVALLTAYALVAAANGAGLRWQRPAIALVPFPPLLAATAAAAGWVAFDLDPEWFLPFVVAAAMGYLVIGHFEPERRALGWAAGALIGAAVALLITHSVVIEPGMQPGPLPAAYGLAFIGASGAFARWRWPEAGALIPPLAALTALTAVWASSGLAVEWYGAFACAAGLGYLAIAALDDDESARRWGLAALGCGALGIVLAHVAVGGADDPNSWALVAAYAPALSGASAAWWRWRWPLAIGLVPPLAAMTALSASWAAWDLPPEWFPSFAAGAALGYLALAYLERQERFTRWWLALALAIGVGAAGGAHVGVLIEEASRYALPVAYTMLTLGCAFASWRWRWRWRLAPGLLPALTAATAGSAAWALFDLSPEWFGAFAAGAGLGYLLLAELDREGDPRAWGGFAAQAGFGAIVTTHAVLSASQGDEAALALVYWLVAAGSAAAFLRWRWFEAGAILPAVTAIATAATLWAVRGLAPEWYGLVAAGAALGYLTLADYDRPRVDAWRWSAAGAAVLGLILGHGAVVGTDPAYRAALPWTDAIVLMGAAAGAARWRFAWRIGLGAAPVLASLTALTVVWATTDIGEAWYGAFFAASAAGYITLAWLDSDKWRPRWLAIGGVIAAAALVLAQATQAEQPAPHWALAAAYGLALVAAAVATWRWRFGYRAGIASLPALAAATGASALWAATEMPLEWCAAWAAAAAAGYAIPAILDQDRPERWRTASLIGGLTALTAAHMLAFEPDLVRWQLPVAYGVTLIGWLIQAVRQRDESALAPPLLTALLGATTLWATDVEPHWWPYPALAVSALLMATHSRWAAYPAFAKLGWAYAALLGVTATLVVVPAGYAHPGHGLVAQAAAALLLVATAHFAKGQVVRIIREDLSPSLEWRVLVQAAFAFALGACASLNGVIGLEGAERAWVVAAAGFVAWLLVAARLGGRNGLWTFVPAALAGVVISIVVAAPSDSVATGVLILATVGPVVAFARVRLWTFLGIANSSLLLAMWTAWRWLGLDTALLPVVFAGLAIAESAALVRIRRYTRRPGEADYVVTYLSWGPWIVATAVAALLLAREQDRIPPGARLAATDEWALAATVLGLVSAAVLAEGLRLGSRWTWVAAAIGLLCAVEMAIATADPHNVQAYAAPLGLTLILLALTFRASPPVFGRHMAVHEAVMFIGALHLLLPPAEQSFAAGGGIFGIELIGLGLGLLAVGLLLHARWLVPVAVAALTGTAGRMVTGGLFTTPYWLLLGLAGMALLGIGVLILERREQWDRFRLRVVEWWREAQKPPPAE